MKYMQKVFVDSDVVISSLLSSTGAAYQLIHNTEQVQLCISTISKKEIQTVMERLSIEKNALKQVENRLTIVTIDRELVDIKKQYIHYVADENDAHIVAGLDVSKAQFLITYNQKDFFAEKIRKDFDCILLSPGNFLQYLRSLK